MLGLAILLGFHFIGIVLKEWLHIPMPANVIGLLLFTFSLFAGWVKLEWVEESAQFLIKHMMLFFLPFVVGSMALLRYIELSELLPVLTTLVVSTFAVLLVTGWTALLTGRKGRDADADHG